MSQSHERLFKPIGHIVTALPRPEVQNVLKALDRLRATAAEATTAKQAERERTELAMTALRDPFAVRVWCWDLERELEQALAALDRRSPREKFLLNFLHTGRRPSWLQRVLHWFWRPSDSTGWYSGCCGPHPRLGLPPDLPKITVRPSPLP